jgi:hypothetical protein
MAAKTGTYTLIAKNTLTTSASSVTFSSIPSTYTDLVLVSAAIGTGDLQAFGRLNGDSGANYSNTFLAGNGTSASSIRQSNVNSFQGDYFLAVSTDGGLTTYNFMDYSNTTTFKTILARSGLGNKGTQAIVNLWRNTAAINSITLTVSANNFATGSVFSLYGIEAGNL